MATVADNRKHGGDIEDHFERKARDLVAPDDEIEAWELDTHDLNGLDTQDFSLARDD